MKLNFQTTGFFKMSGSQILINDMFDKIQFLSQENVDFE